MCMRIRAIMNTEQHAVREGLRLFPHCMLAYMPRVVTSGKHIQLVDTEKVERIALRQEINR